MSRINLDLIRNLAESNATQATEDIVLAIRQLGDRYNLSLECQQAIGELIVRQRHEAIRTTVESAQMAFQDLLR